MRIIRAIAENMMVAAVTVFAIIAIFAWIVVMMAILFDDNFYPQHRAEIGGVIAIGIVLGAVTSMALDDHANRKRGWKYNY